MYEEKSLEALSKLRVAVKGFRTAFVLFVTKAAIRGIVMSK